MERTINRKDYRREYQKEEPISHAYRLVDATAKKSNMLSRMINAMLLFLVILLMKFFQFEEPLNNIKKAMDEGMALDEVQMILSQKISSIRGWKDNEMDTNHREPIEEGEVSNRIEPEISAMFEEKEFVKDDTSLLIEDTKQEEKQNILILPVSGEITSPFGNRESDNPMISHYHTGMDIAANQGTPIVASHDGVVTQVGENGSYGISVMVSSGELTTLYGHCLSTMVKEGENVKQGQTIAKVGMTGNATGPHVHFEVRLGEKWVNPEEWLKK